MNSEKTNVLTSYPDRPLLNLSGKTVLKRTHIYIYIYIYIYLYIYVMLLYQILAFTTYGKK